MKKKKWRIVRMLVEIPVHDVVSNVDVFSAVSECLEYEQFLSASALDDHRCDLFGEPSIRLQSGQMKPNAIATNFDNVIQFDRR